MLLFIESKNDVKTVKMTLMRYTCFLSKITVYALIRVTTVRKYELARQAVILVTREEEIKRIIVRGQSGKKLVKIPSQLMVVCSSMHLSS
jgi:hypothetical protein